MNIFKLLFGSQNEREIKKILPLINRINAIEDEIHLLTDERLKGKTAEFRQRLENGESLDSLLPEAFAVVREASQRTLGMRHFDVQLIGGFVLHQGKIAEMKTGEGKTLCATLPAYLNALSGNGVHVVTVNDYLARRDAEWMGQIYKYLGLSVGTIVGGSSYEDRRGAYGSDITYGQNNEFGFDYLRDNMKLEASEMVQSKHNFAIVDEVDSILIDEARTPLIISGASKGLRDQYLEADRIVRVLRPEQHFAEDLKARQVTLTEEGVANVETMLKIENLYDPSNIERVHHITQALKAHVVMKRDIDYVVRDNQVIIVDEFTGRLMAGRRWSDGLHQAVEAKEGVPIAAESQTLATITFQNFFRMYKKLAGMTGTADTEAVEFRKIYNLEVMMIPTNKPMLRKDYPDVVFSGRQGKFKAVIEEIKEMYNNGQPVLVGTTNIEQSEVFSALLGKEGIPHNVLNAKQHEREAEIVAQAGRYKAVTISTNMAGRGTDIILGGNPEFLAAAELRSREGQDVDHQALVESYRAQCASEREQVLSAGGLHILGTERHESRRIDNQLRGRSGRQGDPGSSRFYVSLEDDLMRRFGGDRMQSMMARVGMTEDDAIEGTLVARAIEGAQKKVEAMHFDMRKHLLEYDDVMNKQREIIYGLRQRIIETQEMEADFNEVIIDVLENIVLSNADERSRPSEWDFESMVKGFNSLVGAEFVVSHFIADVVRADKESGQRIYDQFKEYAFQLREKRQAKFGKEVLGKFERWSYLMSIDFHWKEHLVNIEHLKEGIGLRGYAQQNPLYEYQREALELFKATMWSIRYTVVQNSFRQEFLTQEEVDEREREAIEAQRSRERAAQAIHQDIQREAQTTAAAAQSRVERRQQESHRNTSRQVAVGVDQHKKDEAREKNRLARKARKASRK